jgi:hypothetical protein
VAVSQSLTEPEAHGATNAEPVALLQEEFGAALAAATEFASETSLAQEGEMPVAADATLPDASEPESGRAEKSTSGETLPVLPSRDMWTPAWTPAIASDVTFPESVAESPVIGEEPSAIGDSESAGASDTLPTMDAVLAAEPSPWAAQDEGMVPLFRDAEEEAVASDDHAAPLGHWTDAPSAEDAHPSYEAFEAPSHVDAGPPVPTMEDVSGSLDSSLFAMPAQPAAEKDEEGVDRAESAALMNAGGADRDAATKERQYADVLEAVASRVRAGEIQLPMAPGADDEAAILAAVLASLLSSR